MTQPFFFNSLVHASNETCVLQNEEEISSAKQPTEKNTDGLRLYKMFGHEGIIEFQNKYQPLKF